MRLLRILVLLTSLCVLAGGCSDDGGSSADPNSDPEPTSAAPAFEPAQLEDADLIPEAFPVDEIPVLDGKVTFATDTSVAINTDFERTEAFALAVDRLQEAGFTGEAEAPDVTEGVFTGNGLTVELIVVFDGDTNSGVSYLLR